MVPQARLRAAQATKAGNTGLLLPGAMMLMPHGGWQSCTPFGARDGQVQQRGGGRRRAF